MAECTWTESEKQTVAHLWAEGWTAGRIAAKFPGRSRNAIIGVVHRMKLAKRPTPIRPRTDRPVVVKLKPAREKMLRPQAAPATVVKFPAKPKPPVRGVGRYVGTDGCQWLEGERPTWTKCGCARVAGSSWCETHWHRVFQPQVKAAT
jgi:hypothetical protein